MEPITIIVLVLLGSIAGWVYIVDLFSRIIIPWIRRRVSESVADAIATIIDFADGKIVPVRNVLKKAWKKFTGTILSLKTTYTRKGTNKMSAVTEILTPTENGNFNRVTTEEIVEWDKLPESVRTEMVRQGKDSAQINIKEGVQEKVKERASKEQLMEILEA